MIRNLLSAAQHRAEIPDRLLLQGLPPGVVEMNNTCLSLQQDSAAMQTAEQIRRVVNAAKVPSVNARYDADDNGTGLVGDGASPGGIGDAARRR